MNLTTTGESRVNGYLFVLGRSLGTFLPRDVVHDALREIESHLRERIAAAGGQSDERVALETILAELGPPLRVAQAYSAERTIDEALATGRLVAVVRGIWSLAVSTVSGFFAGLSLLIGYAFGISFLIIAVLKPIFPDNVGLFTSHGLPVAIGARFPAPAEAPIGGYWVVPLGLAVGLAVLVATHRAARAFLGWWRRRRLLRSS